MFGWGKSKGTSDRSGIPEIGAGTNFDELLSRDLVILFKHSHACPVSWAAHSQVNRFLANHPAAPVMLLNVIKDRPFSRHVAERLDVEHESPQVIVLRHGVVEGVVSHGDITEAEMTRLLRAG